VTDQSGKYAPLSDDFILYTDEMPAAYNEDNSAPALVAAEGYDADELAKYLENIATVTVNGTSYAASGRGAVVIINADGTLKTDAAPFAEGDTFEISVSATSYKNDLTFTYTTKTAETENPGNGQDTDEETIDTSALQALITKAEALKQSDYTSASWEAMISTLEEAKGILEAKESQDSVDTAAKALQVAIDSLVKADKTSNSSNKTNSNSSSNKTTTKQSNKTNNLTSTTPKTGDPMNVAGMAAMAIASLGAGGFGLGLRRKSKKDKEA
jgi:LPXTG-motif cell wall-anchored protein